MSSIAPIFKIHERISYVIRKLYCKILRNINFKAFNVNYSHYLLSIIYQITKLGEKLIYFISIRIKTFVETNLPNNATLPIAAYIFSILFVLALVTFVFYIMLILSLVIVGDCLKMVAKNVEFLIVVLKK